VTAPSFSVTQIDDQRCAFVADGPVFGDDGRTFTEAAQAATAPAAEAVLEVEGVCEVSLAPDRMTVVRSADGPSWPELLPRIQYALATVVGAGPPDATAGDAPAMDDDSMFDLVTDIFQSQINPIVAQHGGAIDLIDVQDATVVVRMSGGCQGCGMANVTLRQGIEAALRRAIPTMSGVRDVTDHSAGTNPYFANSGK
jgi:Fe-S cluster biogenesis protein NfuA